MLHRSVLSQNQFQTPAELLLSLLSPDWEARGGSLSEANRAETLSGASKPALNSPGKKKKPGSGGKAKLSYKDRRELGNLPARIEKLELQLSGLSEQMAAPGFYQSGYEQVQEVSRKLAEVQEQLENAYARWDELEANA